MKVTNNATHAAQQSAEAAAAMKARDAAKGERAGEVADVSAASDSVNADISSRAREYAQAKKLAMQAPDVREAKIEELKRRIANKEYNVGSGAIADRMVNEHLRTGGLG